jgi:hypothetical protein
VITLLAIAGRFQDTASRQQLGMRLRIERLCRQHRVALLDQVEGGAFSVSQRVDLNRY